MVTVLVVMVPAAALGTPVAQQGANFVVSVAGTAVGSIPHQIDLKVTQLPGGQLSQVTGFIVGPEDVVQVKQGENLIVSASPDLTTHQVTVINMQGIPIDLAPLPSNAWSLQGLLPGVYTLNVNVAMSSSGILGTYETILVILQPDQQPLPPTTIINQITIRPPPVRCAENSTLVDGKCTKPTPEPCPPGTTGVPPNCEPIGCPAGEDCPCPVGTTGIPPDCQPIICDVEDPPPECEEPPTECPDGTIVPPGKVCPEPEPETDEEEPEPVEEDENAEEEETEGSDDEDASNEGSDSQFG